MLQYQSVIITFLNQKCQEKNAQLNIDEAVFSVEVFETAQVFRLVQKANMNDSSDTFGWGIYLQIEIINEKIEVYFKPYSPQYEEESILLQLAKMGIPSERIEKRAWDYYFDLYHPAYG